MLPAPKQPIPDDELEVFDDLATRLSGRIMLAPMVAGAPNFKAAPHKFRPAPDGNLAADQVDRLCVLTRDFHVLSPTTPHAGTVVVTRLGADGTPEFVPLAGPVDERAAAVAYLQQQLDAPPRVRKLVAANDNAGGATTTAIPAPRQRFELTWFDDIEETAPKESIRLNEVSNASGILGGILDALSNSISAVGDAFDRAMHPAEALVDDLTSRVEEAAAAIKSYVDQSAGSLPLRLKRNFRP